MPKLPEDAAAFDAALLAWYRANYRPLPWREETSLYRTVVSEFMCQQTQIATVLPYFERWMRELPDFHYLAAAPEEMVLKLWEGLGYYSRAKRLQKLAQTWIADPEPPTTAEGWLNYPGVGPYTAAAIASIVFHEKTAVVDGNVVRILARLSNDSREFKDNGVAVKAFTPLANELIAHTDEAGNHNQAMMELGATLCAKANPQCLLCPVRDWCEASRAGDPASLPRLARRNVVQRRLDRIFLIHEGYLLLHQIPPGSKRLAGLTELPPAERCGAAYPAELIFTRRRSIANERIEERILRIEWSLELEEAVAADETLFWQPLDALDEVTFTGPHRKWLTDLAALTPD